MQDLHGLPSILSIPPHLSFLLLTDFVESNSGPEKLRALE